MTFFASRLRDAPARAGPWWAATADLLLGARCHGCGDPGRPLCDSCTRVVVSSVAHLTRPRPCPLGFPLTATAGPYEPVVRALISAHKERQALALTSVLGERLARSVALLAAGDSGSRGGHLGGVGGAGCGGAGCGGAGLVLVPVPSAASAVRARGFDATGALARSAARTLRRESGLSTPVTVAGVLAQRRGVRDQAGLDAQARQANLSGRMRVRWRCRGGRGEPGPVVVVDDLVTTGATLVEAVRALEAEGIRVLGAATIAATVRSLTK